MPLLRWIHLPALLALAGVALGCRTVDLKINNDDRFTPSVRGSYEVYPGIDKRRSGTLLDLVRGSSSTVTARSAGVTGTFAIVAEVAGVQGHDQEDVDLGEDVELQGIEIDGPVRLQLDSENVRGYLAGRGGVRFFDIASFELLAGLGVDSTELDVRTSTDVDRISRPPDETQPAAAGMVHVAYATSDSDDAAATVSRLLADGVEIVDLDITSPTLDDVFTHLTMQGAH